MRVSSHCNRVASTSSPFSSLLMILCPVMYSFPWTTVDSAQRLLSPATVHSLCRPCRLSPCIPSNSDADKSHLRGLPRAQRYFHTENFRLVKPNRFCPLRQRLARQQP